MSKKTCENCKFFNYMSQFCENREVAEKLKVKTKDAYGFERFKTSPFFGCIHFEKGKKDFRGYR